MSTFGPENLKAPAPLTGYAAVIAENLRLIASRKGVVSGEMLLTLWMLGTVVALFVMVTLAAIKAQQSGVSVGSLLY